MGRDFYTFAGENHTDNRDEMQIEREMFGLDENGLVPFPARIAIYDDPTMTPRVVIIDPMDIHHFLEEISKTVYLLSNEQGGSFPYNIIREVVENFIHALFMEPTISIMDRGQTIKFSDRGPGIQNKELAMEIGASSANPQMKRYIRGVGSGLPIVKSYLNDKGGNLLVQDNLSEGTVITISLPNEKEPLQEQDTAPMPQDMQMGGLSAPMQPNPYMQGGYPQEMQPGYPPNPMQNPMQNPYMQPNPYMAQPGYQQPYQPAYTQPMPQAMPAQQPMGMGAQDPYQMFVNLQVSDRGRQAMMVFNSLPSVGPSDLVRNFGGSNPTWSRVLSELDEAGLTVKNGQKRHLTDFGRAYLGFLLK